MDRLTEPRAPDPSPALATNAEIVFSASHLNDFLECEHLTQLELAVVRGELARPHVDNPSADLVRRKGEQHEAEYLEFLKASGKQVVEIESRPHPASADQSAIGRPFPEGEAHAGWWERAAQQTIATMRGGAEIIYQGVFTEGRWRGIADFLERVPRESRFGDWSYEVADTKLARHPKPYFLLQLCFYSEMVARLQGLEPAQMHVILGTKQREAFRYKEFAAYFRSVRARFEAAAAGHEDTYPYPVTHCAFCDFLRRCERQWLTDDHLSLVWEIRRSQVLHLHDAGIQTVHALGSSAPGRIRGIGDSALDRLRQQAGLQDHHRLTGEHRYELLPPEEGRGFALLPEPSAGDIFFDMEGDPFWGAEGGLEYLFGAATIDAGQTAYDSFWAHDRVDEGKAFENFMDFVAARRERYPDLHIYHYGHYEPTALKRLMGQHGTREDALDDLLRNEVLVDLFKVVRQGMRISHPSYSIKKVRTFFMDHAGDGDGVVDAADSIIAYETWMESQDDERLREIAEYNELDCVSTQQLRDWLLERRGQAIGQFGDIPWREPPERYEEKEEAAQERSEREALKERLLVDVPEDPEDRSDEQRVAWLLAQLLDYHRREAKPAWWAYFERLQMTDEELIEDSEAIGGLTLDTDVAAVPTKQSLVYTLSFPAQEHKLSRGSQVIDPRTKSGAGSIVEIDDARGLLRLSRAARRRDEPLPTALIPGQPIGTREQQAALRRLAEDFLEGADRYPALRAILFRDYPRLAGRLPGMPIQTIERDSNRQLKRQKEAVRLLYDSHLFVQGPPGSGKTWRGGQYVVDLLVTGKRVGVAAPTHQAIHNMLKWVEDFAAEDRVSFSGLKKSSAGQDETVWTSAHITSDSNNAAFENAGDDIQLLAGTSWLFAREGMQDKLDYLFIDEAGQISLADALAMGQAARNVVLLGDPLQLAQVSQGVHPEGSGASVLEHLLGDAATIPDTRGIFLAETRRMHPDVCEFISEVVYEGRLTPIPACSLQRIDSPGLAGTGIRYLPVDHIGNSQQSPEEAEVVAQEIERLLQGGTYVDQEGKRKPLTPEKILVVAPYNAQVRLLRQKVPAGVQVGTVDRFQGREEPIVFFSMATSSGEDLPRNLEFLFSRNRLNVAISRAQALAVLVASPKLLEINCHTVDQMRLVNALCRLVEVAEEQRRERDG